MNAVHAAVTERRSAQFSDWRRLFPSMQTGSQWEEGSPDGGFLGRLSRRVTAGISANLISVRTRAHLVDRTPSHVQRSPGAHALAAVQLQGTSELASQAGAHSLSPGDHVVFRWRDPSSWRFCGDFTVFVVHFPESLLGVGVDDRRLPFGEALRAGDGIGPLLVPHIQSIARNMGLLTGLAAPRIARGVIDMMATQLLTHAGHRHGADTDLFVRASALIDVQLADPGLGVGHLADALFVSRRRLQVAFAAHETTVTEQLRRARLEAARADLIDPALADRSIAQIAHDRGFADATHFSHVFRSRFGLPPGRWRDAARHRLSAAVASV